MSDFKDDLAENMKDPNFAYEFGKQERELEIMHTLLDYRNKKRKFFASVVAQVIIDHAISVIKGENKHTHEIEVFGAPCLGGDYHEYCLKCGWVEPCEIDGENK